MNGTWRKAGNGIMCDLVFVIELILKRHAPSWVCLVCAIDRKCDSMFSSRNCDSITDILDADNNSSETQEFAGYDNGVFL